MVGILSIWSFIMNYYCILLIYSNPHNRLVQIKKYLIKPKINSEKSEQIYDEVSDC